MLLPTATAAEDIGASMFTLADHFFQMENVGRAADPFLEGYTSLGYLAGRTTQHHSDAAGHRSHVSPSGSAGQDGDDARRALPGPLDVRYRRRLVRT